MPDEQNDQRADDSADESGTLILPIPADRLSDEGGNKCASDAKERGENKARWIVRPRRQKAGNDASDKTDNDHPDNVHGEASNKSRAVNL